MDDYDNLDLEISKLEDESKILSTFVNGISDSFKSKSILISLGMSEDRYFSALKSLSDKGKVTGVNGKGGAMLLLTTFTGLSFHDAFYELSFVEAMRFLYLGKAVRPMGFTEWLIRRGNSFMWVDCLGYPAKLIPNILNISSEAKWERRDQPV